MSLLPPADKMATWPAPNFVNPQTRRPFVLGIEIPLIFLVAIFVSMRFYTRTILVRGLGADDWFMLAAAIMFFGTCIMTCIATQPDIQVGYHAWDLKPETASNPVKVAQIGMATQLLVLPISASTKVSVLLTYLRVFASKTNKLFCYVILAFTAVWTVTSFLLVLFQCRPIQSFWLMHQYPSRQCIPISTLYYIIGGLNVLTDFLIFLWPANELSKVRISTKQRVTLTAMFTLGLLVCGAGMCRIWWIHVLVNSDDQFYTAATLDVIVAIETGIGMMCGSLLACKPLIAKFTQQILYLTHNSACHKASFNGKGRSLQQCSLSGGILIEEGYSVMYDDAGSSHLQPLTFNSVSSVSRQDQEASCANSKEWTRIPDNAKTAP